jgi:hypothetical protein
MAYHMLLFDFFNYYYKKNKTAINMGQTCLPDELPLPEKINKKLYCAYNQS